MDILFKNDDFVFSYRVGGILIRNGKILLQRPKNDDYSIIGGHVAAMETVIKLKIVTVTIPDCAMGNMIFQKVRMGGHPSIAAASS